MYQRTLTPSIQDRFFSGKVIMLLGAGQIGKTTLIQEILGNSYAPEDVISFSGDDVGHQITLGENSLKNLQPYLDNKKIIFIDEAQKIPNIWNTLKILVEHYKTTKQIIVTGSSSINLLDQTSEPLTGRKWVYYLFPISVGEIKTTYDVREVYYTLESSLIFWSYPAVLNEKSREEKILLLNDLSNSSLYRDVLEFQQVKSSQIILKLLKLLALQIGKEVAMHELATNLGIDKNTVERYIDLLEKSFIIFRLPPYFTNKRKELNKANKIYFYDVGIRNAIIGNYNTLSNRNDVGELRENFLTIERMKKLSYAGRYGHHYFWRNYNQAEIDLIEDVDGQLHSFEFKRGEKKVSVPVAFRKLYPEATFEVINKENFLEFVM